VPPGHGPPIILPDIPADAFHGVKVTTIGDVEDAREKGKDKKRDETVLPADSPPFNLLAAFTELAHLTRPNIADLFTRLTGAQEISFLTKGALESAIHSIGEEIHRQYILTFPPAAPSPASLRSPTAQSTTPSACAAPPPLT